MSAKPNSQSLQLHIQFEHTLEINVPTESDTSWTLLVAPVRNIPPAFFFGSPATARVAVSQDYEGHMETTGEEHSD